MAEQVYFEDIDVGDELPEVVETVDEVQMFFFSAATNNGHRIHYDEPYTKNVENRPTILVHGPLQAALLAKAVTDWAGPQGHLKRFQIQNRGNAFPHEKLTYGGTITDKREEDGLALVEMDIFERNEQGDVLVPGTATVALPRRS
jgi:hydroxyacyl-ACP dehydratase HTD2-like protein with hotdog domain